MQDVVIQMRQEGTFWGKVGDDVEGLLETEMCAVRLYPNAIKHEYVEIAKGIHRGRRNMLQIGRVREVVQAIGDHRQFPVYDLDRRDRQVFADVERCLRHHGVRYQLRESTAKVHGFENILKDPAEVDPRNVISEDRHRSVPEIQRTNIVEPKDVIDVTMGYQDRVEVIDPRTQGLLAKVRGRIDQNRSSGVFDENGNTQAFIPRIHGTACLANAPN